MPQIPIYWEKKTFTNISSNFDRISSVCELLKMSKGVKGFAFWCPKGLQRGRGSVAEWLSCILRYPGSLFC